MCYCVRTVSQTGIRMLLRMKHLSEVMQATELSAEFHRQLCSNHRVQLRGIMDCDSTTGAKDALCSTMQVLT